MFSRQQLEGILLTLAKPEIHVSRTEDTNIGYRVRLRINFRASEEFLLMLARTFEQKTIKYTYKAEEHKSRPRPILTVGRLADIWKVCQCVPSNLPDTKNVWTDFKQIVSLIDNGAHLTLDGLDRILELKGEI